MRSAMSSAWESELGTDWALFPAVVLLDTRDGASTGCELPMLAMCSTISGLMLAMAALADRIISGDKFIPDAFDYRICRTQRNLSVNMTQRFRALRL